MRLNNHAWPLSPLRGRWTAAALISALIIPVGFADDVPVAPLPPQMIEGQTKAYVLENDYLKVVVLPESGQLLSLSYQNSPNLLASLPVRGGPFRFRGWVNADGTQNVLLTRVQEEPLNLKITCHFRLHRNDPALHIKQRIDRFDAGTERASLLQEISVADPARAYFPATGSDPLPEGISSNAVTTCNDVAIINLASVAEALQLAASPDKPWCAVQAQGHLIHLSTQPSNPDATYPEAGTAQLFLSEGQSHAYLQLLGEEKMLKPGESIEQSFKLQITPARKTETPCDPTQWRP